MLSRFFLLMQPRSFEGNPLSPIIPVLSNQSESSQRCTIYTDKGGSPKQKSCTQSFDHEYSLLMSSSSYYTACSVRIYFRTQSGGSRTDPKRLAYVFVRNGQLSTTFCATGSQHATAIRRCHTRTKAMLVHSLAIRGLKCSFHCSLC